MPKVAPDNRRSTLVCSVCNMYLSKYQEGKFRTEYFADCQFCGAELEAGGLNVHVKPSSAKFLRVDNVRSSYWYHATYVEDWTNEVPSDLALHIGTWQSAKRRWDDINSGLTYRHTGSMYKLKLKPNVPILRSVVLDDYVDDAHVGAEFADKVVRYVNLFESTGSISLITRREHFDVIGCTPLS